MSTPVDDYQQLVAKVAEHGFGKTVNEVRETVQLQQTLRTAAIEHLTSEGNLRAEAEVRRLESNTRREIQARIKLAKEMERTKGLARQKVLSQGGTEEDFEKLWPDLQKQLLLDAVRGDLAKRRPSTVHL